MTSQKKLIVIAVLSFIASVSFFFILDGKKNPNIFMNVFEIGMMSVLIFILLAINFFALLFCIKKVKQYFASRK
ncbi:hypothetical protein ACI6PS_09990 [Flavobacterium sp. PLA-1-15]|uniref:hypothetical protein n=1 Tax=Flavobacterium sp. PLA-1-15 TaxID=3380533 RepID=UPI003B764FCA